MSSQKAQVIILSSEGYKDVFDKGKIYFERLAYASKVVIGEDEVRCSKEQRFGSVRQGPALYAPGRPGGLQQGNGKTRKESETLRRR